MTSNHHLIDLSVSIDAGSWEPEPVQRLVTNHREGADKLGRSHLTFGPVDREPRHVDHRDFPDEMGLSLMTYRLTTHTGTHVDAPYHYGWRAGAEGTQRTVTEIPLSWCYGPGVHLDFSGDETEAIDARGVQRRLSGLGRELGEGDIVLINTGACQKVGSREYFTDYRGVDTSALRLILEKGVKTIGTDTFSFDPPFRRMIDDYVRTGDKGLLWPAHVLGRDIEYIQIERLGNLHELPGPTGFTVCCFPIKLEKADAAWSRVVAIVEQ